MGDAGASRPARVPFRELGVVQIEALWALAESDYRQIIKDQALSSG
jgi:hypothetical protein